MSEILESMHDLAKSLHKVGAMDEITMKAMDDLCLPKVRKLSKAEVRAIRKKTRMSQPVFAAFLGVSQSAVASGAWREGSGRASGEAIGHHRREGAGGGRLAITSRAGPSRPPSRWSGGPPRRPVTEEEPHRAADQRP